MYRQIESDMLWGTEKVLDSYGQMETMYSVLVGLSDHVWSKSLLKSVSINCVALVTDTRFRMLNEFAVLLPITRW